MRKPDDSYDSKPTDGVSVFLSGIQMLVDGRPDDLTVLDQAISATQLYVKGVDFRPTPQEGREVADVLNQLFEKRRVLHRNLCASYAMLDVRKAIMRKLGKDTGAPQ